MALPVFDAIVLAGGRGTRLGGVDKSALVHRGSTLLAHALEAVVDARQVVVVGERPAVDGVLTVVEDPPGAGPAAAVGAGLAALGEAAPLVAVLASDVPEVVLAFQQVRAVGRPAVAVDAEGRRQHLLALYDGPGLMRRSRRGAQEGSSMRELVAGLTVQEVRVDAADVDRPEDAARFGITP
ncbi:MAG: NTP transferase domain-containing protein [Aeromicrobium sp.]|uniref:NTP transferase domain-containing protein n=1 Tax=Aeromicrobium sp. TaxID=1871063 RepID=UPI0026214313|nr:NTP transferase domain-containing protein [Aeromicrobium sp.]MDF1704093.1 NTP transferase domain-containing protein [Aeromicrobium sp.]